MWNRLRIDEYVLDNKVFRMSKKKEQIIKEFDRRVLEEDKYA